MTSRHFFTPSSAIAESTVVDVFRRFVNIQFGVHLRDVWELHGFSVDHPNDFYVAISHFSNLIIEYDPYKPLFDASRPMTETRHLVNGTLNWAENQLLAHPHRRSSTQKAVVACNEAGFDTILTYEELYQQTRKAAHALKLLGIKEGDRVAAFAPNNAEAIVLVLAATSIGAIWSSSPAEFGVNACLERLDQVEPTILLSADHYMYGGKTHDVYPKLEQIVAQLSQKKLTTVIIVGQLSADREPRVALPNWASDRVKYTSWNGFLAAGHDAPPEIAFNRGPAMRPLWILFSSGSTGKPKSIVHSAGGMLLASTTAQICHIDAKPTDVYMQFTTLGWMMWNYQIMHLVAGCTIVMFDGSPLQPHSALWDIVERHNVSLLNVSPRYLQVLLSAGYRPNEKHNTSSVRSIGFAGAPVAPELYDFAYKYINEGIYLNNGSGGTDVCHILVGGSRTTPTYYGEIQMPAMGVRVEVLSDDGKPVKMGEEGHLVFTQPIPNMPICFLNDPGDKRYKSTYFETLPGKPVWNQSDWVVVSPTSRGMTILGRSDGVLNPSGVRFGSAELYAVIDKVEGVDDCIAVGQKLPDLEERVILFVKTPEGKPLQQSTIKNIKDSIRSALSNRHVPSIILQAPDLPYTNNMKRVEIAVKKIINGTPLSKVNSSALINPEALNFFIDLPELALPPAGRKSKL